MPPFNCPTCKKKYKTENGFKKHKCTTKRRSIPAALRKKVWEKHVGQSTQTKCFCCLQNTITTFTKCNTFHAGHIISHKNGGKTTIDNLLPICRNCNINMGSENWDDYVQQNNFPKRILGKNPPSGQIFTSAIVSEQTMTSIFGKKSTAPKLEQAMTSIFGGGT